MFDCLVLGHYEMDFESFVGRAQLEGTEGHNYRNLKLSFIDVDGKPTRAIDLLNGFRREQDPQARLLHNNDYLWPVVLYLVSYLTRRGLAADYVNLPHLERAALEHKLSRNEYRTIAITTTLQLSVDPIRELIHFIRQRNSEARIIVGGPFVDNLRLTMAPDRLAQILSLLEADIYVMSPEGEDTLCRTIDALKQGRDLTTVPNITFEADGRLTMTRPEPEDNSLSENMIDYAHFAREEFGAWAVLRTAKSCAYKCAYCSFPRRAGGYSYMDLETLERELDRVHRIGSIATLTFIDDTMNVPKGRFKELLRLMIRRDYGFRWNCFLRVDQVDEETVRAMGAAGCEGVFLGMESANADVLRNMDRGTRKEHYLRAVPWLKDAGLTVHMSFIIGFPGETQSTIQESIELIDTVQPDFFRPYVWYADEASPIWSRKNELRVVGSAFHWKHETMDCATALDAYENVFRSFASAEKLSIWQPEWGFDHYIPFYLKQHGMELDRLKDFVRAFNSMVNLEFGGGHVTVTGAEQRHRYLSEMRRLSRAGDADASLTQSTKRAYIAAAAAQR